MCKVKEGQEGEVTGSTILDLQEAVDNHKEEKNERGERKRERERERERVSCSPSSSSLSSSGKEG